MWICDPLSGAPPLCSPLHPSSWQRLQTAFSHAFPKSRYVDSIRLTSHNGEFVQQGAPHYLNPSVALPLFEICGLDCRGLPSVSFRDGQKVNSSAPFEVHETWLWSIDVKSPLSLPKCLHWSAIAAVSRTSLETVCLYFGYSIRTMKRTNWIVLTEWLSSTCTSQWHVQGVLIFLQLSAFVPLMSVMTWS